MTEVLAYPAATRPTADEDYFLRREVSNSDLSWLKLELFSSAERKDFTNAYRMGNLIDAMITEPHRVNYFTFTLDGEQYTKEEFAQCELMKKAFQQDEFCRELLRQCSGQHVMNRNVELNYEGFDFALDMRIKYDLWSNVLMWGGDIKSTAATTQKQFEEAIRYFDYDRQRAIYMTLSFASRDMIIGISKINYKIFKVPITKDSDLFKSGMEKFTELAFKWWYLFEQMDPCIMLALHDEETNAIIIEKG